MAICFTVASAILLGDYTRLFSIFNRFAPFPRALLRALGFANWLLSPLILTNAQFASFGAVRHVRAPRAAADVSIASGASCSMSSYSSILPQLYAGVLVKITSRLFEKYILMKITVRYE